MILVEKTLGNLSDPHWRDIAGRGRVDALALEHFEAPRSRLRKATEGGLEIAVSLPRSEHLHDGDVLHHDAAQNLVVVARIPLKEVLVITLDGIAALPAEELLRVCFELGHGLGNQHWPAVVKGTTVYVPLSVDRKVMSSVMRTHAFAHVTTRFAPGEEIAPLLTAKEMRMLFAGADATPHHHHGAPDGAGARDDGERQGHGHDPAHGHAHFHEHGHSHQHAHEHAHGHDHEHGHDHAHGPEHGDVQGHGDMHGHPHSHEHAHPHDHAGAGHDHAHGHGGHDHPRSGASGT